MLAQKQAGSGFAHRSLRRAHRARSVGVICITLQYCQAVVPQCLEHTLKPLWKCFASVKLTFRESMGRLFSGNSQVKVVFDDTRDKVSEQLLTACSANM